MSIGVKLRQLRNEKDWSQAEVAQRLKISQSAYNKWECDEVAIDIGKLQKLSKIFETDIMSLLGAFPGVNLNESTFSGGTNLISYHNQTVNLMHSPQDLQIIRKNQEQITQLIESQNKLIENLLKK